MQIAIRTTVWVSLALVVTCCSAQEMTYEQIASATGHFTNQPKTSPVLLAAEQLEKKKQATEKAPQKKQAEEKHGVIGFDIYRDRSTYPIDPRKPCSHCTHPTSNSKFAALHSRIYGFQGRPYKEIEPGACLCGKKKQKFKKLNYNVYWPSFAAGVCEELFPKRAAKKECNSCRFRLVDIFDGLGGFELSPYQRRDNGYSGKGADPYGCLGESRIFTGQVTGVGFRPPGQPVQRGGIDFP